MKSHDVQWELYKLWTQYPEEYRNSIESISDCSKRYRRLVKTCNALINQERLLPRKYGKEDINRHD